jgi:integrase/recombinase XerD
MERMTLSQAIEGYLLAARARRLSEDTIASYCYGFRAFQRHLGSDRELASLSATDIRAFLASLSHLSPKSVRIHYHALAALWTWAVAEGLVPRHVPREVGAPRCTDRQIVPYSREELQAMLRSCDRTRGYSRPGRRACDNSRPTALRDRAILLLLVDTGVRASELCGLHIHEADLRNHRLIVTGKGQRERMVPISPRTEQAIWRYLKTREDADYRAGWLLVTSQGQPLTRDVLRRLLTRIGQRAGLAGVNVHRFRHTCAIQALRNGMNVFALQRLLGHSSLEMVRRYLAIAETDVATAHREASPVTNWLL